MAENGRKKCCRIEKGVKCEEDAKPNSYFCEKHEREAYVKLMSILAAREELACSTN